MSEFQIHFPEDFSDYDEFYIEPKGYYENLPVEWKGQVFILNFFDPIRLKQDLEGELRQETLATVLNTVILDRLTKNGIIEAVTRLVNTGELVEFKPESSC